MAELPQAPLDVGSEEARRHFLYNIRQMQNNAVLLRVHEDDRLEAVFVSEAYAKMMECSVEEALEAVDGQGFFQSTCPEDRPLVRSMLHRRVADDGTNTLTIRNLTAKGNSIWVHTNWAFIDDFGEHYLYVTYYNVTVLKEYEERLRNVYVNLGNDFYQVDERTLALFRVNLTRDIVEEVKGRDLLETDSVDLSYSETIRLRSASYLIDTERKRFLTTFDRHRLIDSYLDGKITLFTEMLYSRRRDGRECYVSFSATLTRHPMTGDMIAFISERERNSGKVREILMTKILAQQFDMVSYLVNGNYGVTIGDADRIQRGSIFPTARYGVYERYLNDQVFPVLTGTDEYKAAVRAALALPTIEAEAKRREPYVVDVSIEIGGEIYYKRFEFFSVDPDSNFFIVLKSDTTEIQKEQIARNDQLRDALEEAKQASVAKTAFLSSMSHEIRTPMNAIIGLDNIALQDSDMPPRTRDLLEKIGSSARHLLGLINDILDMSRIESGRMVLRNEEFSLRSVIEQINTMISGQCLDKGLLYDCKIAGQVDEYYIGDDMKLKQVLINILGNAVKFTPAGGQVTFTVERTAQFRDHSILRFTIADTGIGMDRDYLPRLFDAFSQEDATTTNRYGGSGLGMAITKNIVEMMNGSISVESEKGAGSTFTVNVSLRGSDRSEVREGDDIQPQDLRVLVVDDDEVACEHARIVLEEIGVSADTCLSPAEALELITLHHARREAYDLILVDLFMPEKDGVELTRDIRAAVGGESAIIILTAYSWEGMEDRAAQAGVDSFMSKPLFASGVLEQFRQAIHRKNALRPQKAAPADLEGRRVLLAEDMLINAEIMLELLDMRGLKADHAENGQLAVEMFQGSPVGHYDAVLMDVRMPVLDGLQAAEAIRALDRPDAGAVPIIAMTANAFDEDVQRSLQAGMNAHLTKPVEPQQLYTTLAQLIGQYDTHREEKGW